jgi:hypothetical protein
MLGDVQLKKVGREHGPEKLPREKQASSNHYDSVSISFDNSGERLLVLDHLVRSFKIPVYKKGNLEIHHLRTTWGNSTLDMYYTNP